MLGLSAIPTSKKVTVEKSPQLLPKVKEEKPSRQLFLEPEMWVRLTDTAKFHTAAFKKMGDAETVSRNDIIENFVAWALQAYWEELGGEPTSDVDREKKVALKAELLKKQQAALARESKSSKK